MIIQADASTKKGWDILQDSFDRGEIINGGEAFSYNVLELLALKPAILTFKNNLWHLIIHVQVDNKVALTYLLKLGGTCNP